MKKLTSIEINTVINIYNYRPIQEILCHRGHYILIRIRYVVWFSGQFIELLHQWHWLSGFYSVSHHKAVANKQAEKNSVVVAIQDWH